MINHIHPGKLIFILLTQELLTTLQCGGSLSELGREPTHCSLGLWQPLKPLEMVAEWCATAKVLLVLSVDTGSSAHTESTEWGAYFIFLNMTSPRSFFRHSSLFKKWNNWRAILSRKGQVLSWCICPSESGWPDHLWLSSAIKALDDLPTSILIAKHPVQLVAEGTWGQMGGIWDKFRPSGGVCLSLELSARSTSSGVHLDISLGKGTEPITQTVSHKTLKEGCPGTPTLTDICMHTYAHTHSQNSESWRISSRGLLVWATTDVLRCIRYVAYKIPTKHFPLGTERWTASSCKTVPLSLAINWPWCWALSVNMCSVCRSTCEWRQGSRKAISNTCSLKSWRATKYIFVPPASYVIKKPITSQRKYLKKNL